MNQFLPLFLCCRRGAGFLILVLALARPAEAEIVAAKTGEEQLVQAEQVKPRVTLDVQDTDIKQVLDAFAQQTGLSIVTGKDVTGPVSAKLKDVEWDEGLDAILKANGLGYDRSGNILTVLPVDKLQDLNSAQPVRSKVFKLRYRDAGDLKGIVAAQLSPRGTVEVIEETGQKGWEFGAFGSAGSAAQTLRSGSGSSGGGQARRAYKGTGDRRSKSKTLVVTDIPAVLDRVDRMILSVDVLPQQVLIMARFLEVNRDKIRDLGLDVATGSTGTSTAAVETVSINKNDGQPTHELGAQSLGSLVAPAALSAVSSGISEVAPFNTGLSLVFRKLTGSQFDVLLHALEEDVNVNTLSAPSIVTLDNQEANILVGTQYPILTSSVAGTTATTTVTSLDYYQDIGVQLRVVPQIAGDDHINMIVHPAVTSFNTTLSARSPEGTTLAEYPILITREAETQILMKDGETIVIGGLLKDVKSKGIQRIPFLGSIPVLGWIFQRRTDDVEKIDLLIFITAEVVKSQQTATQVPVFVPASPSPKAKIQWRPESAPHPGPQAKNEN